MLVLKLIYFAIKKDSVSPDLIRLFGHEMIDGTIEQLVDRFDIHTTSRHSQQRWIWYESSIQSKLLC